MLVDIIGKRKNQHMNKQTKIKNNIKYYDEDDKVIMMKMIMISKDTNYIVIIMIKHIYTYLQLNIYIFTIK